MVSRAGRMSDSELRSTLEYLQQQIDDLESLNQPTPPPTTDNLLYYKNAITELAWLGIGSGLQISNGSLIVTASVAASATWGNIVGTLSNQSDLQAALDAKQGLDATLTALAALTTAADKLIYTTGSDTFSTTDFTSAARSLLDDASTSAMRTTLGLAIGTDVQAYDADLAAIAALSAPVADRILFYDQSAGGYAHLSMGTNISISGTTLNVSSGTATLGDGDYGDITASGGGTVLTIDNDAVTYAKIQNVSATDKILGRSSVGAGDIEEIACTAAGRALLDDADAAAQRTTLGLVIGTNVQAYDAELAAIAGLTSAADRLPYFTGSGTAALATFTAAGRALVDDADASAQRTTLGLAIGTDVLAYNANLLKGVLPFIIDGGGAVITTGVKGDIYIPVGLTITGVIVVADQSGSIVIDLWKDTYTNFAPTVADTITASAKPTLSAATKSKDTTLTGWTTSCAADTFIRVNVDSVSTVTRVGLYLLYTRT